MTITASMVKELRERTGVGMMECKKALQETGGDLDAAVEALRKKGAASADKKSGRVTAEGVVAMEIAADGATATLVEVNCETDFVAKEDSFKAFAAAVARCVTEHAPADVAALGALTLAGGPGAGSTVEQARVELVAGIGENVSVRRFARLEAGSGGRIEGYLHGTRIGVLVEVGGGEAGLGRDLAMHVAASRPLALSEAEMPAGVLDKEREIFRAQAEQEGKPPEIVEKMVSGRVKKFLKENTLLGQPFVKDPDTTVGKLLGAKGAEVSRFERFEVGEGLEKRADDFVAEVMAQAQGG